MNAQWMYPSRLRDVFDFGEEELAANRNGQITEYQRRRLLRRLLKKFAIGIPFFLIALLLTRFSAATTDFALNSILVLSVIVICGFLVVTFVQYLLDIQRGKASAIHGLVSLYATSHYRSSAVNYKMRVHDMTFSLSRAEFQAFKNGEVYSIYYAPNSHCILSVDDGR